MKNITLLTTKYPEGEGDEWLTNELVSRLSEKYNVDVIHLSWSVSDGETKEYLKDGAKIHRLRLMKFLYGSNPLIKLVKMIVFSLFSSIKYFPVLKRSDILLASTPCIAIWAMLLFPFKRGKVKKYLICWDFFPYYLDGIWEGHKKKLFLLFFKVENYLYNKFNVIGCMTKGNIDFLNDNYFLSDDVEVAILPLWADIKPKKVIDKTAFRIQFGLPFNKKIIVYGGAMTQVQELDKIILMMKFLSDAHLVMIGKGPDFSRLSNIIESENIKNVSLLNYIPRDKYEDLVASCDLGVVSLSCKLKVPSFPSKTIDYLKVGLPIIAFVDSYTDYSDILESEIKAGKSINNHDVVTMSKEVDALLQDSETLFKMSVNGRAYYEEKMNADIIVSDLTTKF